MTAAIPSSSKRANGGELSVPFTPLQLRTFCPVTTKGTGTQQVCMAPVIGPRVSWLMRNCSARSNCPYKKLVPQGATLVQAIPHSNPNLRPGNTPSPLLLIVLPTRRPKALRKTTRI